MLQRYMFYIKLSLKILGLLMVIANFLEEVTFLDDDDSEENDNGDKQKFEATNTHSLPKSR